MPNITQTFFISCKFRQCSIDRSRIEPLSALSDDIEYAAEAVIRDGELIHCHLVDVVTYGGEFIDCEFDAPDDDS
jgi:hypothetical protein